MRYDWIIHGLWVTGRKGVRLAFLGKPEEKADKLDNKWGFEDPHLDVIWEEQVTLPRGGVAHHRTDLIVEWNRIDVQRGAKFLMGLGLLLFVAGFLLGGIGGLIFG